MMMATRHPRAVRALAWAALAPALVLAGCDSAPKPEASGTAAVQPIEAPSQASILRPDMATPTPTPTTAGPLRIVIGFPDGGVAISPEAEQQLQTLLASPQAAVGGPIRLSSHTDSAGNDAANLAASRRRGEVVRDWLIKQGIAADRLGLVAFGEQNPARPNALPDGSPDLAGRAANRRVEIVVDVPAAAPPEDEESRTTLVEELGNREGASPTDGPPPSGPVTPSPVPAQSGSARKPGPA